MDNNKLVAEQKALDEAIVAFLKKVNPGSLVDRVGFHNSVPHRITEYTRSIKPFMNTQDVLIEAALKRLVEAKRVFYVEAVNFQDDCGYRLYKNSDDPTVPVINKVYTYGEILKLNLNDSPCLQFRHNQKLEVIQDCFEDPEVDSLEVPGFSESKWKYRHETNELIPVFIYVGETLITDLVTIDNFANEDDAWVCPIGFYRTR